MPGANELGNGSKNKKKVEDEKERLTQEEEAYEHTKFKGIASGGYLIGRHPECENKGGDTIAVVEDLSSNGTFINEAMLGRNKRRELQDQDEITVKDGARFVFRYPRSRDTSAFLQQYTLLEKLGKGHFAEVFLCVEKSTGHRYAVKVFTKQPGVEERSKTEGLQQEIAVLMGDTFDESNAVYLVLELAAEGELFNWIVMKQKLTEDETRKVFIQLFQGMKYLHERGIVHRDIKPENILLTDKNLHVKVADFGLAKIIGEESFTTTLCGTPSYVAPEILEESRHRRYTRAVDVWSLGVVLDNPYTLTQQIKMGRFDYPSPYWDSVGDPALDLIDRMLTVDVEKRYTIDDCLEHPWTTQKPINTTDSTDGLVGGIANLDFIIDTQTDQTPVRVYVKNPNGKPTKGKTDSVKPVTGAGGTPKSKAGAPKQEESPSQNRGTKEFMELGGKGDQELYGNEDSVYAPKEVEK
ncbi:putative serine/threonine-protein kinase fhkC [Glarea lozoyensis 74030]|uniref:Putative serine/threonine-protein kinase fhkC n=1 Tax=Glarea lozoyensis (strain ATCC 74030 / MF5533) TaxID=1104152 RepID=H0EZJ6_GLAL7|nr:putative serine/threonine-protein kinase fhkC [Glarea lozoyensis 74030]